jgi:membrane protein YqaA with SNARE-associated domain
MANSSTTSLDRPGISAASAAWWLAAYALLLTAGLAALSVLVAGERWTWSWKGQVIADNLAGLRSAVKLLALGIYLSLACTFVPLNTGVVVAAVAMHQARLAPDLPSTALLVGLVGAAASTIANLNDYHVFSLLLRRRRVAAVRHTRIYRAAAAWFAREPFGILVVFNIVPIPVDVIRMLAVTYGYPRRPFAIANFAGRFVRYAAIAGLTYALGCDYGWLVVAAALAVAVAFAAARLGRRLTRKAPAETDETPAPPSAPAAQETKP